MKDEQKTKRSTNDVFSADFESKLDPMFRSDAEQPKRKPRPRFNTLNLGRGMMPPVRDKKGEAA